MSITVTFECKHHNNALLLMILWELLTNANNLDLAIIADQENVDWLKDEIAQVEEHHIIADPRRD